MSEGRISPHEAQELDACFRVEASDLFGYACAVTRGDRLPRIEMPRIDLPRIEMLSRKPPAGPLEQAFPPIALDRCWQLTGGLPEQQHAAALLRWGLGMKEGEIAAVLGIAEKTVSVHLYRIRRKLLLKLGADRPWDDDAGEGASP